MKPLLELPGEFKSEAEFSAELGELLAQRNFFHFNGQFVHLVETHERGPEFIEVTPEYLSEYINREFRTRCRRATANPGRG